MTIYDDILSLSYMIIIHTHLFLRIAPPLVIVEDCFEKLFLKNILFEDGMETCRVLNLFKRKAERFWVDWHFQRKVETFRMLEGPPRLSLSLPILEENLLFAKIKSATFSGRGNVDRVIAEWWIETTGESGSGENLRLIICESCQNVLGQQFPYKRHKTGLDQ